METMEKLTNMNVLIAGLRGLGAETAKNLILSGPKSVTLYDPTPVTWGDLSSNFCLREEHVGKISRAEACFENLKNLNSYDKVHVVSTLTLEDHANFHVVAFTEILTSIEEMIEINEFARSKNIGFILSQTYGPQGFTFVDYGHDFVINDENGEETFSIDVEAISQTNPCIVTVDDIRGK
jgi:ubiquitin-activating enzyme E1